VAQSRALRSSLIGTQRLKISLKAISGNIPEELSIHGSQGISCSYTREISNYTRMDFSSLQTLCVPVEITMNEVHFSFWLSQQ
jgi:hypothetical protein